MFDEAQKICNFKVTPAEENAYQIQKGQFIVTLPQASTINLICQNGTHAEIHLKQGSQKFNIDKGCYGELKQHRLISDYSDSMGTTIKEFGWEWDSVKFMDGQDEYLQKALEKLEEVQISRPELTELRYLATVPDYTNSDHYNFGYVMTLVCVVSIIIGVTTCGIGVYTRCGCCCSTDSAANRRGRGQHRRSRNSKGSWCCCCRRSAEPDHHQVRFSKGNELDESDAASIVDIRPMPTPKHRTRSKTTDVEAASKALEKRLSTLERQYRQSRSYD
jgi:hypothetical protein